MRGGGRRVELREERFDGGSRYLTARMSEAGELLIIGQDLGEGTPDGDEYEWTYTYSPDTIPAVVEVLGGDSGDDVLDVLEGWRGERSYDLEQALRDSGIPRDTFTWP